MKQSGDDGCFEFLSSYIH